MGMYIFISEQDRREYKKVSDKHLNNEFQEALKCEPRLLIMERKRIRKRFLIKDITSVWYDIYHETERPENTPYQARYQFSGSGELKVVLAYLHGIINGYHSAKPKTDNIKQD